jgi:hypothetical protein
VAAADDPPAERHVAHWSVPQPAGHHPHRSSDRPAGAAAGQYFLARRYQGRESMPPLIWRSARRAACLMLACRTAADGGTGKGRKRSSSSAPPEHH